ncbi:PIN domain-containing protein [Micropruina sp.]|uniref:PIN domain-containing protein n=1 Tax=Micropruina sp. TaxID=2737536 RepID=UPI0039E6455E
MNQVVFVDANVWFSRALRDWIGLLYTTPDAAPFEVKWTEDVLAEVLYHLRRKHPEWAGSRITGIRDRLAATFEVGRVDDFTLGDDYKGGDPFDAHVHAAAVACRSDILLTTNVADFYWDDNESSYEVMTPDEFLLLVDDSSPELVVEVTVARCHYWFQLNGEANLPSKLRAAGCPGFAERVRLHLLSNGDRIRAATS